MQEDSSRNTIIFLVCALVLFILYNQFVMAPRQKALEAERKAHPAVAAATVATPGAPTLSAPLAVTRAAALAASARVPVMTPDLKGSISLRGARLDDLFLTRYRQTTDKDSPAVEMLRPEGTAFPWFVDFGWVGQNVPGLPGATTNWTLAQGSTLAPGQPIVLTYDNGQGLTFTRRIEIDPHYMFTLTDTVANTGAAPVTLAPYGSVQRQGLPPDGNKSGIVHQGWKQEARGLAQPPLGAIALDGPADALRRGEAGADQRRFVTGAGLDQHRAAGAGRRLRAGQELRARLQAFDFRKSVGHADTIA